MDATGPERVSAPALLSRAMELTAAFIREEPSPREYLLTDRMGMGVLIRSKVGLFAAKGGTGKTLTLFQLTVAVATGTDWLNTWQAAPGRVLLLVAEEDAKEARTRLHNVAFANGAPTHDYLERIADNVTILPLAGVGVAFTREITGDSAELPETERAEELREVLRGAYADGRPYTLVILDPLSRFAGADVEKDNAMATRFVQTIETFTSADCGAPNVIVSHHWRKRGQNDREGDSDSADLIRGASGLVDGVRWAATLDQKRRRKGAPELAVLRVVKTNYAAVPDPIELRRHTHGILKRATDDDLDAYKAASGETNADAVTIRVLGALGTKPMGTTALAEALGVRKATMVAACEQLERDMKIYRLSPHTPWLVTPPLNGHATLKDDRS